MAAVWRWLRKWWWVLVAAAGALGAVLFTIFASNDDPAPPRPKSNLRERAQKEVERIRLEGEVEKARVRATADAHRAELERIEDLGDEDPVEARRQLSDWLNRNL